MDIKEVTQEVSLQTQRIGKMALSAKHPEEFESYLIALELVNAKKDTLQYFIFPVMPSSLDLDESWIHNIKKTLGGMVVLSSESFVSTHINLSGSFGRKFRVLINNTYEDITNFFQTKDVDKLRTEFNPNIKSGYGCCKVLENIMNESIKTDSFGPRHLIFHNFAFGKSYIVKNINIKFSQSEEKNMIWQYNLSFQSIAPISTLYSQEELDQIYRKLTANKLLQSGVNNITKGIRRIFTQSTESYFKPF